MTPEELKQQIRQITVWKRGEQRAPHKPLLLLYALGRCLDHDSRLIPYAEVDRELKPLLMEFGPERKACHFRNLPTRPWGNVTLPCPNGVCPLTAADESWREKWD